jgi:hypothetical protein
MSVSRRASIQFDQLPFQLSDDTVVHRESISSLDRFETLEPQASAIFVDEPKHESLTHGDNSTRNSPTLRKRTSVSILGTSEFVVESECLVDPFHLDELLAIEYVTTPQHGVASFGTVPFQSTSTHKKDLPESVLRNAQQLQTLFQRMPFAVRVQIEFVCFVDRLSLV